MRIIRVTAQEIIIIILISKFFGFFLEFFDLFDVFELVGKISLLFLGQKEDGGKFFRFFGIVFDRSLYEILKVIRFVDKLLGSGLVK